MLNKLIIKLKKHKYKIMATSLETDHSIYDVDYNKKVIVIGNEANGVSEEVLSTATGNIRIPMAGELESLNAAVSAAIVMYETARQRR